MRGAAAHITAALVEPARLAGWWATSVEGAPRVGEVLDLTFGDLATLSFVIRVLEPGLAVRLECTAGPEPWCGSMLSFDLDESDEQIFVTLTHRNDSADDDAFLYFNTKWPLYLLSLRDFVETGTGRPYPKDDKIHHGD